MLHMIRNEWLQVTVDTLGAQLRSICTRDGIEYLWQGDPVFWNEQAPVLFPYIGRLTDNSYQFCGKTYSMGIHGFAKAAEFTVAEQESHRLVLELRETEQTLKQYPFRFVLQITYSLREKTLDISFGVRNTSDCVMPFGIGGHPGFNVPLVPGECFEDYEIEFNRPCLPDRIGFTQQVYLSGKDQPYPLEEGKRLALRHELFDEDAIILKNMARQVTLRSRVSGKGVCVSYPDMPYLGLWHWPKTQAPYICIEPWSSLPSRQDVIEEISCKSDLNHLTSGGFYETIWSVTVL